MQNKYYLIVLNLSHKKIIRKGGKCGHLSKLSTDNQLLPTTLFIITRKIAITDKADRLTCLSFTTIYDNIGKTIISFASNRFNISFRRVFYVKKTKYDYIHKVSTSETKPNNLHN